MKVNRAITRTMKVILTVPLHPELKKILHRAADAENLPMNEFVARVLAKHFNRPELGTIPRKKMGRPALAD